MLARGVALYGQGHEHMARGGAAMVWQTVATKGQRAWHHLPPPATLPLVLAGGLYWLFALWTLASAGRYASLGIPPGRLWVDLVALPLLLGAQPLAAGLGIWRAAVGW